MISRRWRRGPDVVWQRLGDELVLINLKTNRVFSLNRTGRYFLELVEAGHGEDAVRAMLLRDFDVHPDDLDRELEALIASLVETGFIHESGGDVPTPGMGPAVGHRRPSFLRRGSGRLPETAAVLVVRLVAWSLALPILKRVLPLPRLVRLMSDAGTGGRSAEVEEQVVKWVGRVYRFRSAGTCLERSLVAYRYLSRANAEPRLVVGMQRNERNVLGHAWVVVDGTPLYESLASIAPYVKVVEFTPNGRRLERDVWDPERRTHAAESNTAQGPPDAPAAHGRRP